MLAYQMGTLTVGAIDILRIPSPAHCSPFPSFPVGHSSRSD